MKQQQRHMNGSVFKETANNNDNDILPQHPNSSYIMVV